VIKAIPIKKRFQTVLGMRFLREVREFHFQSDNTRRQEFVTNKSVVLNSVATRKIQD